MGLDTPPTSHSGFSGWGSTRFGIGPQHHTQNASDRQVVPASFFPDCRVANPLSLNLKRIIVRFGPKPGLGIGFGFSIKRIRFRNKV